MASVFEEILLEEYERSIEHINFYKNEIKKLPRGSIQKKRISGKEYFYLQYKEKGSVKSQYVKKKDLESLQEKISYRKSCEKSMQIQQKSKRQIERALGKEFLNEHSTKSVL